jgi:hypothetical protein
MVIETFLISAYFTDALHLHLNNNEFLCGS